MKTHHPTIWTYRLDAARQQISQIDYGSLCNEECILVTQEMRKSFDDQRNGRICWKLRMILDDYQSWSRLTCRTIKGLFGKSTEMPLKLYHKWRYKSFPENASSPQRSIHVKTTVVVFSHNNCTPILLRRITTSHKLFKIAPLFNARPITSGLQSPMKLVAICHVQFQHPYQPQNQPISVTCVFRYWFYQRDPILCQSLLQSWSSSAPYHLSLIGSLHIAQNPSNASTHSHSDSLRNPTFRVLPPTHNSPLTV